MAFSTVPSQSFTAKYVSQCESPLPSPDESVIPAIVRPPRWNSVYGAWSAVSSWRADQPKTVP